MKINKEIFNRIEFWIVFFFIIRLIGITNPPIEASHNWRQTTGLMVARNFYEVDPNILYPRLDFAGDKTGITGTEFPLYNYLIYLLSLLFGYNHWFGRLINLIFSSAGIYYFFLITKEYINKKTALYSAIILTCSLWFQYSRKTMPDIFSLAFVLAGMYYGLRYLIKNKPPINIIIYAILTLAGLLSKIPSAYILVLFLIPLLIKQYSNTRKHIFIFINIIIIIPVIGWYYIWIPYLNSTFEFVHYYMGVSFKQGFIEIIHRKNDTLKNFYEHALMYTGFIVFVYGLVKSVINKEKLLISIFILCLSSFLFLLFKMGHNFPNHTYYVLIFIPVMALIAGYGIASTNKYYLRLILIITVCVENIMSQQHDFFIKKERQEIMTLEKKLEDICQPSAMIAINCSPNPAAMYISHHKGWISTNNELNDQAYINDIFSNGCKYAIVFKKFFGEDVNLNMPILFENNTYKIYEIPSQ